MKCEGDPSLEADNTQPRQQIVPADTSIGKFHEASTVRLDPLDVAYRCRLSRMVGDEPIKSDQFIPRFW